MSNKIKVQKNRNFSFRRVEGILQQQIKYSGKFSKDRRRSINLMPSNGNDGEKIISLIELNSEEDTVYGLLIQVLLNILLLT